LLEVPVSDSADTSQQWLSEHHAPAPQASEGGTTTLAKPAQWFIDFLTGNPGGERGTIVNEFTALNYAALYSCVSLIAQTVASLPLKVYRRRKDGGQDEAADRPEYARLQVEFNPNTSAMSGREAGLGHLLTWGNSYCQIVRNRAPSRDVIRLQPLGPDIVCPGLNDRQELEYEVYNRESGKVEATLRRDEVLHVAGFGFDAMVGYSTVKVAKSVIRTGMSQDREAERFATRGFRPPGAIKMPLGKKFADEQQAMKFRNTFRKLHATEDGSLNILILEDGTEWVNLGIDPESAQLLESRKFSPQEIASIYHVPPHMAGLVEKVTSWGTGIEEMTIGFVVYCLLPIIRRIEQEYNRKFFGDSGELFCEHVLSGLLRGDSLKQAQAIQIYMNLGLLTVNEARRILGWNPVKGGNIRYYPLNMGRVDENGDDIPALAAVDPGAPTPAKQHPQKQPEQQSARSSAHDPVKLAVSLRKAIVAAAGRCLRKEAAEAVKAARKPESFLAWVDAFYDKHAEMLEENMTPLVEAWAEAFGSCPYLPSVHIGRSRADLLMAAGCRATELVASIEKLTERWTSERLAELAAQLQPGEAVAA
jgi:HK97 family phage portal protein